MVDFHLLVLTAKLNDRVDLHHWNMMIKVFFCDDHHELSCSFLRISNNTFSLKAHLVIHIAGHFFKCLGHAFQNILLLALEPP